MSVFKNELNPMVRNKWVLQCKSMACTCESVTGSSYPSLFIKKNYFFYNRKKKKKKRFLV